MLVQMKQPNETAGLVDALLDKQSVTALFTIRKFDDECLQTYPEVVPRKEWEDDEPHDRL
jgi:hypothetical protein